MGLNRTCRIVVAYDGTAYAGWQKQPGQATIQGVLERAAEAINGCPSPIMGAGRTDAGVHARGQAARFVTQRDIAIRKIPHALNAHLPEDVVVTGADMEDEDFHPIRDAVSKHYRYTFRVAEFDDPFDRGCVLRLDSAPDQHQMQAAAAHLCGRHDFAPFQKTGSPRDTTVRTLSRLDVARNGDYIFVHLVGNGFLYGMARNLAGTILRAGQGRLDPATIPVHLGDGSRVIAGPSLPARGLCLMEVSYDDSPQSDRGTR